MRNESGLEFNFTSNGSLYSIKIKHILVNLYIGNELEASIANFYLRVFSEFGETIYPLFGPNANTKFEISESKYLGEGIVDSLHYQFIFSLHPVLLSWSYSIQIKNLSNQSARFQFVYTQDLGLCDYQSSRLNEFFVSHYIHHEILETKENGYLILSRQNEPVSGYHPACLLFSNKPVTSFATDALDIFENRNLKEFPSKRKQGEHSVIGLGGEIVVLKLNEIYETQFFGYLWEDLKDLEIFPNSLNVIRDISSHQSLFPISIQKGIFPVPSLFSNVKRIKGEKISEDQLQQFFPDEWREVEQGLDGHVFSFFTNQATHVVLQEKEFLCLRPHGQILRTGRKNILSESSLTATSYLSGIFLSQLTQGHTSLNTFISRNSTYTGQFLSQGFRIFIRESENWNLLDTPTFGVMRLNSFEWVYVWKSLILKIKIESTESNEINFELNIIKGEDRDFLLSFHIALDGDNGISEESPNIERKASYIHIRPNAKFLLYHRLNGSGFKIKSDTISEWKISDDRNLFLDMKSRGLPYFTALVRVPSSLKFQISGDLEVHSDEPPNRISPPIQIGSLHFNGKKSNIELQNISALEEILPWFLQNAEIHFLNPRGLEQYSGGGWGTRDVCQGAFEYLIAQGDWMICRDLLLRVFEEQNEDGDWPQWFMLYPRDKEIRASDSHADIIYWPILSLTTYIERTNDLDILMITTKSKNRKQERTILSAVEQAHSHWRTNFIKGTVLPKYGNGDWNDSLQPLNDEFRNHAVSTWNAELSFMTYTALFKLYKILEKSNLQIQVENEKNKLLQNIKELCMEGGVLAGIRNFKEGCTHPFLLHPSDTQTGVKYSLIPMIYGILSEILDPIEVEHHLKIIKDKLTGPDGVRLFDIPIKYNKGFSNYFRRAETASYFGREIGLMYTHAHLRYCEALGHLGKSKELLFELSKINPIGIQKRIPSAKVRQSNCYYTSSDGQFLDREEAFTRYQDLLDGNVDLEGGWRVYSSGPGIFIKLFYESLLGIRQYKDGIEFDPILPLGLHGTEILIQIFDKTVRLTYQIVNENATLAFIELNGHSISFERKENRYRRGGGKMLYNDILIYMRESDNFLVLKLY
ncbi:MAG: hypothetical protein SH817_06980 [Leptospira sp.]|nr:hypothetical protein [Leptospira sp.]